MVRHPLMASHGEGAARGRWKGGEGEDMYFSAALFVAELVLQKLVVPGGASARHVCPWSATGLRAASPVGGRTYLRMLMPLFGWTYAADSPVLVSRGLPERSNVGIHRVFDSPTSAFAILSRTRGTSGTVVTTTAPHAAQQDIFRVSFCGAESL